MLSSRRHWRDVIELKFVERNSAMRNSAPAFGRPARWRRRLAGRRANDQLSDFNIFTKIRSDPMAKWLITGVSSGFGRALAEAVLAKGDTVAGTVRNEVAKGEFEMLADGRAIGIMLDVTDQASVVRGVRQAEEKTGGIDIVVNNAGYGLEGAVEEVTLDQVRQQFEVNVFGAVAVVQAVLPFLRKRRAGHIINITSMGGLTAFPGVGIYCGSKFALEGISESLSKEVKPLGIKVTIVEPGSFRTDWAGRSMAHAETPIADYETTAGAFRKSLAERNGRQAGDPKKAAAAIMAVVESDDPPLRLLLGPDAMRFVGEKLGAQQAEILKWAPVSANTNFSGT
jgi:NAD(P)-dependent dehydrogenase (short-subunit alcohol dehydrogenase family)